MGAQSRWPWRTIKAEADTISSVDAVVAVAVVAVDEATETATGGKSTVTLQAKCSTIVMAKGTTTTGATITDTNAIISHEEYATNGWRPAHATATTVLMLTHSNNNNSNNNNSNNTTHTNSNNSSTHISQHTTWRL